MLGPSVEKNQAGVIQVLHLCINGLPGLLKDRPALIIVAGKL